MKYTFLNGQVAIMVRYWEEHYEQVDGGARIDLRRVRSFEGAAHRPGAAGYRILPVSEGGIWRIDLSTRLDSEIPEKRYHHHPHFQNGDVGPRVFDDELSADPIGWTERRLLDLPNLLAEKGMPELRASIDTDRLARAMPLIRLAIEDSLHP